MAMVLSDIKELNTEKILKMSILHDWAESKIGDFMPDEISSEKKTELEEYAMSEILDDLPSKFRAFNWDCTEVDDGHSFDELITVQQQQNSAMKPKVIIAHTTKGKGIKAFENDPAWHARKIKGEELEIGRRE